MADKGYEKYLQSRHWKNFRKAYEKSDRPQQCRICGNGKFTLHHITYKNLFKESFDDVMPLCFYHHSEIHEIHNRFDISLEDFEIACDVIMDSRDLPRCSKECLFPIKVIFKYFVYGDKSINKVLAIGKYYSSNTFYEELSNFSSLVEVPKATIFSIDEPTFNHLKSVDGVRVI